MVEKRRECYFALAKPLPSIQSNNWYIDERAYCPLCNQGSTTPYEEGYKLPDGLRRHLTGYGNTYHCPIFKTVMELARDSWNEKFRKAEEMEKAEKLEKIIARKRTEILFVTAPLGKAQLIDEDMYLREARSNEELTWAEQRLVSLGFIVAEKEKVRSYTKEMDECTIFADPRCKREIQFVVYKKPFPKIRSNVYKARIGGFSLPDNFKHDIDKKFQKRLDSIISK